jgi:hypothetical protein
MAGFTAFVLCLMILVIGAEDTSAGITRDTLSAAAALTWAAHNQLEERLLLATAEAERVASELEQ